MDRPQLFPPALPTFDLPCPDLEQVRLHLRPALHTDEDPLEDPLIRLRKLLLDHITL